MSEQTKSDSIGNVLYAGLGVAAGIVAVIAAQWGWNMAFGPNGAGATLSAAGALGVAVSNEAQTMGLPLVEGTKAYWYVARAGGVLAYLLLWFAAMWGVIMSSKMLKGVVDASLTYGLHEFFPMLAVFFAVIHAAVLLGDAYIGFGLTDLLVPFTASYRPLWSGLGTIALYLSIALVASFYLRRFISRRAWRLFHYTSYLAVLLALAHGLQVGSDSDLPVVRWGYSLTGASLLFVTIFRIVTARSETRAAAKLTTQRAVGRPMRERAARSNQPAMSAPLATPVHVEAEQVL